MSTTRTSIAWTDRTWSPTRGCRRVSPGCGGAAGEGGCYAERQAYRFSRPGQPYEGLVELGRHGPRWTGKGRLVPRTLAEPLSWRKPAMVFVDSMSDLFFEAFTNEEIAAVFGVMAACPHLTFQVLTKRAKRMREWFEWVEAQDVPPTHVIRACARKYECVASNHGFDILRIFLPDLPYWPLGNVWIGVSVEDQRCADERIPELLAAPVCVRFVSAEPLLGPVDFEQSLGAHSARLLEWVIVGAESGPGARPFDVEWAESILYQCLKLDLRCFIKQLGARPIVNGTAMPLRHRKGDDPNEWPEHLRVQEFPRGHEPVGGGR